LGSQATNTLYISNFTVTRVKVAVRFSSGITFQDVAAARTDVLDAQPSHIIYGVQTKET
jgi:hypothetical protein